MLATTVSGGLTAPGLADLELGYAPAHGSAKGPPNTPGHIAGNIAPAPARPSHGISPTARSPTLSRPVTQARNGRPAMVYRRP
ncbi:hypothetical protein [Streptomyces sp. NPDC058964]|uniref:hypothetical protein n=1 Tax=Streptomyces sp. NPDC058964 TaxID=3346681 RepID=UPI0036B76C88